MPTDTGFDKAIGSATIRGGPIGELQVPGHFDDSCTLLSVQDITQGTPPTSIERKSTHVIVAGKANTLQNTAVNTTGRWLHIVWALPE